MREIAEGDTPAFKFPLAPSACLSRSISFLFLYFCLFFFCFFALFFRPSLLSLGLFPLSFLLGQYWWGKAYFWYGSSGNKPESSSGFFVFLFFPVFFVSLSHLPVPPLCFLLPSSVFVLCVSWVSSPFFFLPPPLCFLFVVFPVSPDQCLPCFLLFLFSSSSPRFCSFFFPVLSPCARLPLPSFYKARDSPGGGNGRPPKCSVTDAFNEETYALAANGWNGGRRQWTVVQETAPFSIQPLISIWSFTFWQFCN